MEQLWRKESYRTDTIYVDCFKDIDLEFEEEITNWLLDFHKSSSGKNNNKSDAHLKRGEIQFQEKKWKDALISFNRSLCLASKPSKNVETAYIRRAECLYNLSVCMNSETCVDDKMGVSTRSAAEVCKPNKARPNEKSKKQRGANKFQLSLSFKSHAALPEMANVLEICENTKFGRHIVAKCNITVGKTILAAQPIARVCVPRAKDTFCLTCYNTDANFIACEQCTDAFFCDEQCAETNLTHPLECNSIFHQIGNCQVKLTVQLILSTVKTFRSSNDLINHFENLFENKVNSRLELLLKFKKISQDTTILRAYRAFKCLMTMPIIKLWFYPKKKQRFLMHLTLHYMLIVPANSFCDQLKEGSKSEMQYIFDVISLFNHSCAPNAFYIMKDNTAYLFTVRPIEKGEQIFINYLGDASTDSIEDRKFYIKSNWDFDCECERCSRPNQLAVSSEIMDNAMLRYINKHDDDYLLPFGSTRRTRLRNECIKFMQEHGLVWSKQLQYVAELYILCCTE